MNSMIDAIKDELITTDLVIPPEGLQMESEPVPEKSSNTADKEAIQAREVLRFTGEVTVEGV